MGIGRQQHVTCWQRRRRGRPAMEPKPAECREATLRWFVNTSAWRPSEEEFNLCLRVLPAEERPAVLRYRFEDDRKRTLAGRLLARACVRRVCDVANEDVQLLRTKGKKPFTTNAKPAFAPNFNFNVSHEGEFTALASEPVCVSGIDVAAPQQLRRTKDTSLQAAIQSFKAQFASSEWLLIQSLAHDDKLMEACFQRLWSLKEAFIKARGDGLGFAPLSRAEFCFLGDAVLSSSAELVLDGVKQPRWRFELHRLSGGHWVSVARGPPEEVIDAFGVFKHTFGWPQLSDEEMQVHLAMPSPAFQEMHVRQLLPPEFVAEYWSIASTELVDGVA